MIAWRERMLLPWDRMGCSWSLGLYGGCGTPTEVLPHALLAQASGLSMLQGRNTLFGKLFVNASSQWDSSFGKLRMLLFFTL